jgi:hypothetical protein
MQCQQLRLEVAVEAAAGVGELIPLPLSHQQQHQPQHQQRQQQGQYVDGEDAKRLFRSEDVRTLCRLCPNPWLLY